MVKSQPCVSFWEYVENMYLMKGRWCGKKTVLKLRMSKRDNKTLVDIILRVYKDSKSDKFMSRTLLSWIEDHLDCQVRYLISK